MNRYPRKGVPPTGLKMGGTVDVKNLFKPKESSSKALFSHYSQVLTRVEGGIGGPNTPAGALGSPVIFHRTSQLKNSNFNTRAGFTITFA